MEDRITPALARFDGLATRSQLRALGCTTHGIRESIASGSVHVVRLGMRSHRFGYAQVMEDLDGCVEVIGALLAQGRPVRGAA